MNEIQYIEKSPSGKPTGRKATIHGELVPFGHTDLLERTLGKPSRLNLRIQNANVISSSIPEIPVGPSKPLETTIETHLAVRHVGLVRGGWFPAGLEQAVGSVILIDRCTLTELKGRFKPGGSKASGGDFVDWLDDPNVKLSPALLALEGNQTEHPSADAIEAQMKEHAGHLRALIPNATVIGDSPKMLKALTALAFSEQHQTASERTIEFLLSTEPLLRHPVSRARLPGVMAQIAANAGATGLSLRDPAVMCAISAAGVRHGRNAAKRALKFVKAPYTRKEAYNAMCDMRALKAFASLLSVLPDENAMWCTSDKDLSLVWCGMSLSKFDPGSGLSSTTVTSSPLEAFLPMEAQLIYRQLLTDAGLT
ncbi:hypothetical protein [Acidovorax sp. sic0104]|uniref:hypothetical protein n=1 Tax=Acidovorax sp. sic0104 TaxID=2854784 RepID=UPI001C4919E2|nr:hypothetical protein [Acidovorax sp. sic0104]MBV7541987.1 hypothetical protein [Acidovorax sp. sic0104]